MIDPRMGTVLSKLFVVLAFIALSGAPAAAQAISQGPTLAIGITDEDEGDLIHTGVGWRWEFHPGEAVARFAERFGTTLTWAVEPQAAILSNDRDGIEFQVVPYFELSPRSLADARIRPSLEGGIGLMYIDVTGFDLGSQIQFSDNIGIRLDIGGNAEKGSDWSIAYRFRHISHAGLWAESNSGLNTHWLTLNYSLSGN